MSIDFIRTTKGLRCVDKQCDCIFAKDIGGPVKDERCIDNLAYPVQQAQQERVDTDQSYYNMPGPCLEEVIDPTDGGFPRADISLLSQKHKDYAKNIVWRLRYFDKEYIKNFFLYVIELL